MEYEMVEKPRDPDKGGDSRIVREHSEPRTRSSVDPENYPGSRDRAVHIPEEE